MGDSLLKFKLLLLEKKAEQEVPQKTLLQHQLEIRLKFEVLPEKIHQYYKDLIGALSFQHSRFAEQKNCLQSPPAGNLCRWFG